VGAPGRRTVYSMCGMCAVRCPIEVTVEDGRVVWLQGDAYDKAFVAGFVSGMDTLREAVEFTTPEWQENHTGIPADQIRAFARNSASPKQPKQKITK
jgi:anaerobic selenocysteine-containing dehydrogenase